MEQSFAKGKAVTIPKARSGQKSLKIQVKEKFLTSKMKSILNKDLDKPKFFYENKFIFDAEIKGCFDNIDHKWILDNVPIPNSYIIC